MKKVISVTKEQRAFLRKAFGVSDVMVWYALTYNERRGNTDLARRIRSLALQRGGVALVTLPMSEVIFNGDGTMCQWFENGMSWEADKATGRLELRDGEGKVVETRENAAIADIERLQARLAGTRAR